MTLYKFSALVGSRVILTKDKAGGNLPGGGAQWKYLGEENIDATDGPRIGASSADIIKGIEKEGYFVWPQRPKVDPPTP